jgi:uncharacterized phage protein (TIGR02218 family)
MKTIASPLQEHLLSDVTTLCTCWKLTRRDGVVLGFTDHDLPLTIGSVIYHASTGFNATAVASSDALNVDNLDVEGILASEAISEEDILRGAYDFAEVQVFMVNHQDITQGTLPLRTGWMGEIAWNGERFIAEIRGLTQKLSQTMGEVYSPTCRASLGDGRCRVDMTTRTVTGTLTSVISATVVRDNARTEASGTFTGGILTLTTGENSGLFMEITRFHHGQFTFALPLPYLPENEDGYIATYGCDKRATTCKDGFSNLLNFRGEPHVSGLDAMLETASTRSRL